MRVIHWFRNDLRLRDNTALADACTQGSALLPVFIVEPALLRRHRSPKRRAYLAQSIQCLARDLEASGCPLLVVEGAPGECLAKLVRSAGADLVTFNRDYSPYARRRDGEVAQAVAAAGADAVSCKDRVVFESDEVLTKSGAPFRVYTPYRNAWMARWKRSHPTVLGKPSLPPRLEVTGVAARDDLIAGWITEEIDFPAGEQAASKRLAEFLSDSVADYDENRDIPGIDGTSRLSPALRFGSISIRTCVERALERKRAGKRLAAGAGKWVDELIWREFYLALLAEHPHVLSGAFHREYDAVEWNDDPDGFAAWCEGRTGYPIVDAAMRQLVQTGWMHNRARMIVASFLVKDLLIDWRRGERFFMEHLVDGDPAANNGGWQWAASTGTDAQPYFRIFNPVSQGKKFDADGEYVRRFVPELANVAKRYLHSPWEAPDPPADYPGPIVDHGERRIAAIARFEAAKKS